MYKDKGADLNQDVAGSFTFDSEHVSGQPQSGQRAEWSRPAPLKVESLKDRALHGHYHEVWAHVDEGGYHVPLTTSQIAQVRSLQEGALPHSHADARAQALQRLQELAFLAPPSTPQVAQVRAVQEAGFRAPPTTPAIASVRSVQEDVFRGSNDLEARLVAAASVLPTAALAAATSVPIYPTAPSAATFARSTSMGPHAPLPTPTAQQGATPAGLPPRHPPTPAAPATMPTTAAPTAALPPTPAAPAPTPTVSASTAFGASVWGSMAAAVHSELQGVHPGQQHASGPASGSPSSGSISPGAAGAASLLAHAAAVAAVRRQEEDSFQSPAHSAAIDAVRAHEERAYRVPANTPQVAAVRSGMASFRSGPLSPQLSAVRARMEALAHDPALPALVAGLRAGLDDPFRDWHQPPPATARSSGAATPHSHDLVKVP
uniref:Uncharacterized protein n=1 Tax=Chlamydomonas leiostraca TaxID=1034604 RepID=A0A7S0WZA3_9CHLO|mmetsp:Transcript_36994/g.93290  ORF Transcript_36994/g.93290 Transcript_36994/m.93290 type:complete len:432 (+) Transcript_36994:99-1394(+)|eukprot:CAMPEP_0202866770 /NCGR_PEP_ID=MMETSP1391-20130828/8352_1 /ASSEMBLY_ACC=CAM_ASM_000867 /TAXON_ID=1034604 /ORGANISM="Chlamydomonas leiostraca, Strain SAG 11-49" /LENGTH=431 /DNA_ID=CAMNT_0049546753 /DNA_START=99 /DNA_END=1394 /DNA_ORIENTATION=-